MATNQIDARELFVPHVGIQQFKHKILLKESVTRVIESVVLEVPNNEVIAGGYESWLPLLNYCIQIQGFFMVFKAFFKNKSVQGSAHIFIKLSDTKIWMIIGY